MVDTRTSGGTIKKQAKVIVLGQERVGKTSLILRFAKGVYDEDQPETKEAAQFSKDVLLPEGGTVQLNIWDTAGQEKFQSINKIFYRGSDCVMFTYDVTRMETLSKLEYWVGEVN